MSEPGNEYGVIDGRVDAWRELIGRAIRGEKTNPCPGHKYYLRARHGDGAVDVCGIPFDCPEAAALLLAATLEACTFKDEIAFDIVVKISAAVQ